VFEAGSVGEVRELSKKINYCQSKDEDFKNFYFLNDQTLSIGSWSASRSGYF
jgi:hypothetical protein